MQKTYLEQILGFIGFTEIHALTIEETLGPPEVKAQQVAAGMEQTRHLARTM
jgi:FMN-dependent NADH-azoreductase